MSTEIKVYASEQYVDEAIENIDISEKMDKANPTGTGKFSVNRKSGTTAGSNSVAVGTNTTASGNSSFAEGYQTEATGDYSHAEGRETKATNFYAHAEGHLTQATSGASHAEGKGTIASAGSQHVQGKYNITNGSMAHIVGWGENDTDRKNIHTLSTGGEAWFQGDIYVGSTSGKNKDSGSKKVFTRGDYTYTTTDPGAGSPLAAGNLIFVYE